MFINPTVDLFKIAIESSNGKSRTYYDLEKNAKAVKKLMNKAKCCVLILADRSIEVVSMYYYCYANNDVPFVMDERTDIKLLNVLLQNYQFSYVFCHSKYNSYFDNYDLIYNDADYNLLRISKMVYPIHKDLAVLMSTSGSTGSSKSVRITYENLRVACEASARFYRVSKDDVGLLVPPLCYCFGQVFVLMNFMMGAKLAVTNSTIFEPDFWTFFDNERVNGFFCVPYTATQLLRLGFFSSDRQDIKYICQGGGKSDINVEKEFINGPLSKHANFYIVYGQTEAVMISSLATQFLDSKRGSVGVGLPNISVSIKDGKANGEIVVKGRNISMGYANNYEDLSRGDDFRGVLYTGDIGEIDEDGFLFIKGRSSRFSKIAGIRFSHDEIERIASGFAKKADVVCVGDDSVIVLLVVGDVNVDDFCKSICSRIHLDKRYLRIIISSEIPLLPNGKIDYSMIKNLYL